MDKLNRSQNLQRSSGVTSSSQPSVRNPGNPFPQEGIGNLSDPQGEITHLSDYLPDSFKNEKHNNKISNTWAEIIKNEDFVKLDEIIQKTNNLVDPKTKEEYLMKIYHNVEKDGSLEVYSYVLENLQGSELWLGFPYRDNPNFVPIVGWMHANSHLETKEFQDGFYSLCQSIKDFPQSVTPEDVEKCKLMLYLGCSIKAEGEAYTPYNRITEGIGSLQRKPDSEAKIKALAVFNEIKGLFDQVETLDKEGLPRQEMEILEIPSLSSRSRIKSASSYGNIVE